MNTKPITAYTLLLCLFTVVVAQKHHNQKRETDRNGISINEIRNYRKMFRVNQEPVDMVEATRMMCAPPQSVYGPHYRKQAFWWVVSAQKEETRLKRLEKLIELSAQGRRA